MKQACLLALLLGIFSFRAESRQGAVPLAPRPRVAIEQHRSAQSGAPVQVLALLVQFQEDTDPGTAGNGQFLLSGSPNQIDPPPHDTVYFSSKLRFLENYFAKVSNGVVSIQGTLFPHIITLADSMAVYSPAPDASNKPLADLAVDSWTAASGANPSFPFNLYDAFIVFHAGVGKDVDLVSLLGFDPSPRDIPSLYLSLATLREYLGDPGYQGIPVGGGSFLVTNSMIMPETETRVFTSGSQSDTLQLGINGLLAASFGSFLGLPDLFDTQTGRSGIGQFGLMDGASIFAYNGLFPPEPSAWEKIYLGWTTPITIATGSASLAVPAVGLTQSGNDTVYKIPISSTEYFLIENRHRDPEGDGLTLTILQQGQLVNRHFSGDTAGFVFYDLSGIDGSVVDVQNPDWALPGSTLDEGFEGGGILIWHIDESDFAARIAANTLNADPDNRTVDLEEADGSQDIGQSYGFLSPGSGTESGWPLDFWFSGNQAPAYKNRFDESSFPDSKANSGAGSLIRIHNIGPVSPRVTLSVTQGTSQLGRAFQSRRVTGGGQVHLTVSDSGIYYTNTDRVVALRLDGSTRTGDVSGLVDSSGSVQPLAVLEGNPAYAVGARDSSVMVWELTDSTSDGIFDSNILTTTGVGEPITAPPILIDSAGNALVVVGTLNGRLVNIRLNGTISSTQAVDTGRVESMVWYPPAPGLPNGRIIASTSTGIYAGQGDGLSLSRSTRAVSGVRLNGADVLIAADPMFGFSGFDSQFERTPLVFNPEGVLSGSFAPFTGFVPTDLDKDGRLDIVAANRNLLIAVNDAGIIMDGFPVYSMAGFLGTPLLADITGDGYIDIVVLGNDGTLHVYRRDGRPLEGFPVHVTMANASAPAVYRAENGNVGFVIPSGEGAVDGWEVNQSLGAVQGVWLQQFGTPGHSGVSVLNPAGTSPISTAFLPSERVYPWPNPVYGSVTRIRYYTSVPAAVSVKILTLTGELVAELSDSSPGGVDAEIPWDVSNIGSGIYFARIEANGGGKSDVAVIKIAVVK